jgi:hypothetical protein
MRSERVLSSQKTPPGVPSGHSVYRAKFSANRLSIG